MSKKKAPLVAESLKDMIEYQSDSIVSRTLLDKKAGTVTLFAFDEGQGLSEHISPYDATVQIIDGEAIVNVSGTRHCLKEDWMIIIPGGHPHALKAQKKFKMLLTMIRA